MAVDSDVRTSRLDVSTWSDLLSRDALELITASVAEMAGFEIAALSVARDEMMVSVAVSGGVAVRDAMLGRHTPTATIRAEIDVADDWGRFKFLPHERLEVDVEVGGWVSDRAPRPEEGGWHPLDLLVAPLHDPQGALIGLLSIDLPLSGLRPDGRQRQLLERYAVHAERALRIALEREALSERVRLVDAARSVVRFATSQPDLERVLDDCRHSLLEGFRADDLSIRTWPAEDADGAGTPVPEMRSKTLRSLIGRSALTCWRQQRVALLSRTSYDSDLLEPEEHVELLATIVARGWGQVMLVPLGAGSACLGHLILARRDSEQTWTVDEQQVALDVARDIGQAVVNSRTLVREQRLVRELRSLDTYRSQLLSTVSHELKNPLSAITGHLELLEATDEISEQVSFSLEAMGRATRRLGRIVDNLLVLAEAGDPDRPVTSMPVDVRPLVRDALELTQVSAERRHLTVRIELPDGPVMAACNVEDVDRVLTNLVSNAVKYTPRGGTITVSAVRHRTEVELSVADEGIGISVEDQDHLFTEFFRSSNPRALAQPGTGLGLVICRRVVARHGGRIELDSTLGVGSTFRVFLPVITA